MQRSVIYIFHREIHDEVFAEVFQTFIGPSLMPRKNWTFVQNLRGAIETADQLKDMYNALMAYFNMEKSTN